MKIAQISLLHDAVAPWSSSNAGRAASYLIEELVREGHEVTLFASVQLRARDFDVVHLHIDRLDFPLPTDPAGPCVATLHAPCGIPEQTLAFNGPISCDSGIQRAVEIATRAGMRLIIQDGVTGFVVRSTDEAVNAVARSAELDRYACRRLFEERFDVRRMTSEYLSLYRSAIHAYDCAAVTVAGCLRGSRDSITRWRPSWR